MTALILLLQFFDPRERFNALWLLALALVLDAAFGCSLMWAVAYGHAHVAHCAPISWGNTITIPN
jgi:hypothetical protein